jgi:hypothetical protein
MWRSCGAPGGGGLLAAPLAPGATRHAQHLRALSAFERAARNLSRYPSLRSVKQNLPGKVSSTRRKLFYILSLPDSSDLRHVPPAFVASPVTTRANSRPLLGPELGGGEPKPLLSTRRGPRLHRRSGLRGRSAWGLRAAQLLRRAGARKVNTRGTAAVGMKKPR